jgi:hypothetical protein
MAIQEDTLTLRKYFTFKEALAYCNLTLDSTYEMRSFLGYVVIHGWLPNKQKVTNRFLVTTKGTFVPFYPRTITSKLELRSIVVKELAQIAPIADICDILDTFARPS